MEIRPGDIFLIDDDTFGAKTVKFLMTAPTCWQHFWRALIVTQEKPLLYHAGIFMNSIETIEQQWKCEVGNAQRIINSKKNCIIFRFKGVLESDILDVAVQDIGKPYGVVHCIGKTITWITGIKWFSRYFKEKEGEICINRVCKWIKDTYHFTFGHKTYTELTTWIVYKYIKENPDMFDIIYEKVI